ncbi:glycosyltransferase [Neisseria animalis]|uniref:Glycosyltransferase n=1 Tax=Neisseria animalis TaxID=492 RepID=A0A5P3MRD4_NEIAN|nr:glycosyltransferase [Neisseria animalis]QEY23635.1 glycosyltransferase [Neisseria animalis]ROW32780.1 glycosyltransferase [Neisseria animalis]VEE09385.1 glycoside hydrolase family protein [Neisseria animalis]
MNIAIAAPFCSLPSEPHFNRFWYLATLLAQTHNVLLITSNFRHYDKTFRRPEDAEAASQGNLNVLLLPESGYTRNVSLRRLYSHRVFVRHFRNWLQHQPQGAWDIIYSAYPLIATNLLLGEHKTRLGCKLVLDVQDVWPESFSSVIPLLKKIPHRLLPFAARADQAYKNADGLIAVSQTYLERAREANPDVPAEAVFIGADFPKLEAAPARTFDGGKIRFFYLGTLSFSYDVETVCRGILQLHREGAAVELHILGGGPDEARLKQYESEAVCFYGYLPYAEMMSVAKGCDIAVNPIHAHAMQSVTNKLSDYMALQKPVLNSQTDAEAVRLLSLLPHEHYRSGNVEDFVRAARRLMPRHREKADGRQVENLFKRDISYRKIISLIESLNRE